MRLIAARLLVLIGVSIAMGFGPSFEAQAKEKSRGPASVKRHKPTPLAAPHLYHPVPSAPDWVVGIEVASKNKTEPSPRPELDRPEFIQASGGEAPALQREHGYHRDHRWVVRVTPR